MAMSLTLDARRLEGFADPSRGPYRAIMHHLKMRREQRRRDAQAIKSSRKLPCRVTGTDLQRLEGEFGWKLEIVDRSPAFVPFAEAKMHCLSMLNREIKSWDGEEVIAFDYDMMTQVVKFEHYLHSCRTYCSEERAASYVEQELGLRKALEGKNLSIVTSAAELLRQVNEGGGHRVCKDAASCAHIAHTILFDLAKTDIPATQAAMAIKQHQAGRAKAWFFFETDMFVEDYGDLTSMPGKFMIDRQADRVYIFPDGQSTYVIEYSFSNMMSYVLQSDVVVDGEQYVIEVHDSMDGVKFIQMTRSEFDNPQDSSYDLHYYRPNEEKMVVIEQMWTPPVMDGVSSPGRQKFGRMVLPEKLVEKVVGRAMSTDKKKLSLDSTRAAVKDFMGQEVTRGTNVVRPKSYPVSVFEQLAQYAWKRAVREKAEMEVETAAMKLRVKNLSDNRIGWINAAMHLVWSTGAELSAAFTEVSSQFTRGFTVEADYTYRQYALEPMYVVRNVVRRTSPDSMGARFSSCLPGGDDTRSTSSTVTSADKLVFRARAVQRLVHLKEGEAAAVEVSEVKEHLSGGGYEHMSDQRDQLVEKMQDNYDAHDLPVGSREEEVVSAFEPPSTSEEATLEDPNPAIMDDYRTMFPQLDEADTAVRTHLASSEDRVESFYASKRTLNRTYDEMARDQIIRPSQLKTGGGGKRVITQQETTLCFNKRIFSAPRAQLPCVMQKAVTEHVDRFFRVCMRPSWQTTVTQKANTGMWSSRLSELGKNVRKTDQSKVTMMLQEAFSVGEIDMSRWKAMVKSVPKSKTSPSAAFEHSATQTIVYQESKMTNAYFSSMLSEFHDTLDECLRPNIRINVRRDNTYMEKWFNSFNGRRFTAAVLKSYEADISQCDKSHTVFNWLVYFEILRRFGCPDELIDVWSVMIGRKEASASMVAMLAEFFEMLASGVFLTISFNSLVCCVAVVCAMELEPEDVITGQAQGDDSLFELNRSCDVAAASEFTRDVFNLESKFFESQQRYFCGYYYVHYDGYFFRMRDPVRAVENQGRHVSSIADLQELHRSLVDTLTHYDKKEPCDQLAFDVAARMEKTCVPRGMIRGLASYRSWEVFERCAYEQELRKLNA